MQNQKKIMLGGALALFGIVLIMNIANKGASAAKELLNKYGGIKENDPRLFGILKAMWMHLGYSAAKAERYIREEIPWSAAMISYAMKKYPDFPKHAAHAGYAVKAKENRFNNTGKFWLWRTNEYKPKIGDIVIKSRAGSGTTFDNVRVGKATHGDIVVDIKGNYLITIGGNVGNTFSVTKVKLNNGFIADSRYFGIVQNRHKN